MKIISTGSIFNLYPDDMRSFDKLPADYYVVRFNMNTGFYLEKYYEFIIPDAKIYGVHMEKVKKVLTSYKAFDRSLGVILSGDKGIGKSLFARLLGREAVENGIPVIIVESYVGGIGSYIDKIDQEVLVLFDEFDKTFAKGSGESDPQAGMLSLFDGVSQGKKLFVVTCNELWGLNSFLINRPGRFHYHFRFKYPTAEDIREYLDDKLLDKSKREIENVVDFSQKVALNYDCLRAIAFELNLGQNFSDAIADLNIINVEKEEYKVTIRFTDGTIFFNKHFTMDLFNDEEDKSISIYNKQGMYAGTLSFPVGAVRFNSMTGEMVVDPKSVEIDFYYDDEDDNESRKKKQAKKKVIQSVKISRMMERNIHYAV